jgi:hypothetical protein
MKRCWATSERFQSDSQNAERFMRSHLIFGRNQMMALMPIRLFGVILIALFLYGYGCSSFSSTDHVHLAFSRGDLMGLQKVAIAIEYDVERDYHKARSGSREALGLHMAGLIAAKLKEKIPGIEIVDIPGGKEKIKIQETLPDQLGQAALEKLRSPYGLQGIYLGKASFRGGIKSQRVRLRLSVYDTEVGSMIGEVIADGPEESAVVEEALNALFERVS